MLPVLLHTCAPPKGPVDGAPPPPEPPAEVILDAAPTAVRGFPPMDGVGQLPTYGSFAAQPVLVGWPDGARRVVFANGGDMSAQPLTGFSRSNGRFVLDWYSRTATYDSGIATGDLDGDSYADLVVAVLWDPTRAPGTGGIRVHWGGPDGPDRVGTWIAGGPDAADGGGFAAGGVALADVDLDGRQDVVVAVEWESPAAAGAEPPPRGPDAEDAEDGDAPAEPPPEAPPARINGLGPPDGRPRIFLNRGERRFALSDWRPEPPKAVGETWGARAVLLLDFDEDGWLDLALGSRRPAVFFGAGDPKTPFSAAPGWQAPSQPLGHQVVYSLAPLRQRSRVRRPLLLASLSCLTLKGCEPSRTALAAYNVKRGAKAAARLVRVGLWRGNVEYAGPSATADLDGDGSHDVLAGAFTAGDGAALGGAPLIVYRGHAENVGGWAFEDTNPTALADGPDPLMPSALLVAELCNADEQASAQTERFALTEGRRAVFTLPVPDVRTILGVELERPDGTVEALCDAAKRPANCDPRRSWSAAPDRGWVLVAPPPDSGTLRVHYEALSGPDVLVANGDPRAPSRYWCNHRP